MWSYLMVWVFVTLRHRTTATTSSLFEQATTSSLFVDKTNLIDEILRCGFRYWIVTCPRGFGKSTNHDMLKRFFEIPVNQSGLTTLAKNQTDNYKLFTDPALRLQITKRQDLFEKHFGEYMVLSLDLDIQNATTYQDFVDQILHRIRLLYNDYQWLYDTYLAKQLISFSLARKIFKHMNSNQAIESEIKTALRELSRVVQHYLKKPVVLLIDNYDTPTWTAFHNGLDTYRVHQMIKDLVRGALDASPKYIERAVILGISGMFTNYTTAEDAEPKLVLREANAEVVLENIPDSEHVDEAAYEELRIATFLNGSIFDGYYGFTESEVAELLRRSGIGISEIINIQQNHGRYNSKTDQVSVYNPSSVVAYINERTGLPTNPSNHSTDRAFVILTHCLKHRNQRTVIQELILNRKTRFFYQTALNTQSDIASFENTLNPATQCDECNSRIYIAYLYDLGYITNMDKRYIGIVNSQIQSILEHHLHEYFVQIARIDDTVLHQIAISFHDIVDQLSTSNETKKQFKNSLLDRSLLTYLYDEKQPYGYNTRKQDFHALLYVAASVHGRRLYGNISSNDAVDQLPSRMIKTRIGVDEVDIVIASKSKQIILFAHMTTDESLKTVAQHVTRYVPAAGQEQAKYVKYLAIATRDNKMFVAYPPVAEYVDGQWQIREKV